MKRALIVVDGENDFGDEGAMAVPGGTAALLSIGQMVRRGGRRIDAIIGSIDMHPRMHIGHCRWFLSCNGSLQPDPFRIITASEFRAGDWRAADPRQQAWTLDYLLKLEDSGKRHQVFPEHCIIGTWGCNLIPSLQQDLFSWEDKYSRLLTLVQKGMQPRFEQFSMFASEVSDPAHDGCVNLQLLAYIQEYDEIGVGGLARGHCVGSTVLDMGCYIGWEFLERVVLLTNGTADVRGEEARGDKFVKEAMTHGMRLSTVQDWIEWDRD